MTYQVLQSDKEAWAIFYDLESERVFRPDPQSHEDFKERFKNDLKADFPQYDPVFIDSFVDALDRVIERGMAASIEIVESKN